MKSAYKNKLSHVCHFITQEAFLKQYGLSKEYLGKVLLHFHDF